MQLSHDRALTVWQASKRQTHHPYFGKHFIVAGESTRALNRGDILSLYQTDELSLKSGLLLYDRLDNREIDYIFHLACRLLA